MAAPIIKVENLSKLYRIGKKDERAGTLIQAVGRFASSPVRNFRKLRSLTNFDDAENATDILWALRDVSFEVVPGEVVGLIGRNGAGKSTLLKILSRIMPPTRGRAEIHGRLASLLEVGTGFHPELSGRDNIFLNGAILGMTRNEIVKKFDEIVAFAEIEKFIDTPVKRYSSGMYVRLAFAVAAHLEPEILIVDEVLAVGDTAFQQKCIGKIKSVSTEDGRTVIFVSHNLDSILRLATRCIWLNKGSLQEVGDTKHIVNSYQYALHDIAAIIQLHSKKRDDLRLMNVEFLSIEFLGDLTHPWMYPFGEEVTFKCRFRINRKTPRARFSYAIFNPLGTEIASTHVLLDLPADSDRKDHMLNVLIPNLRLAPGTYSITIGFRSDIGEEDLVENAARFDITTNAQAIAEFSDYIRGAIIPEVRIQVT